MLTRNDLLRGRRPARSQPSLRQQYDRYLLQRIEAYKNALSREELLRLGDEAAQELQTAHEGQFLLTEILMLETVDRLIIERLGLGSYRRWKSKLLRLRTAQREPTHWGVDPYHPVAGILPRLEAGDHAVAVGSATEPFACLLAAFDLRVTFLDADIGCVERIEARVTAESLGGSFEAFVTQLGHWLPPIDPACLVVLDASTLAALTVTERRTLLGRLQERTIADGIHAILPGTTHIAPEGYLSHYGAWERLPAPPRSRRPVRGLLLAAPPAACVEADAPEGTESVTDFSETRHSVPR